MAGFWVPRRSTLLLPQGCRTIPGARPVAVPAGCPPLSEPGACETIFAEATVERSGESRRPVRCGVCGGVRAEIPPPSPLSFLLQRSCSQKAGRRLAACPPASRISGCSLKLADSYLTQTAKLLSFPLGPPSLSLLKCQITAYI